MVQVSLCKPSSCVRSKSLVWSVESGIKSKSKKRASWVWQWRRVTRQLGCPAFLSCSSFQYSIIPSFHHSIIPSRLPPSTFDLSHALLLRDLPHRVRADFHRRGRGLADGPEVPA